MNELYFGLAGLPWIYTLLSFSCYFRIIWDINNLVEKYPTSELKCLIKRESL
jgi:hypothetical protein